MFWKNRSHVSVGREKISKINKRAALLFSTIEYVCTIYYLEYLKNCPRKYLKVLSTNFIFRQQKILLNMNSNQNRQAESRPLCNQI